MRKKTLENDINGVVSGNRAVINIQPGQYRIHDLQLFVGATGETLATAIVDRVTVKADGYVIRDLSVENMRAIALLNQVVLADNQIPIFASETWRATAYQEEMTAWDTRYIRNLVVEVVFKSGLTAPTLVCQKCWDEKAQVNEKGEPFLLIVKHLETSDNSPAGLKDYTGIPTDKPINRIYIRTSTGAITNLEALASGNQRIHEATKTINDAYLASYGITGSVFTYALVFDPEQQINNPLLTDILNLRLTFASTNNTVYVREVFAPNYAA
jgi:hypothetical protein